MRVGHGRRCAICPGTDGEDEQGFGREVEEGSYEKAFVHSLHPGKMFPDGAFQQRCFHHRRGARSISINSSSAAANFVNLLDTNAVDIDQAPIAGFDYNELEGGVDDHGGEDEVKEVDEGTYQQSQAKEKSVRSKNYTILEDQILIKAWSTVSMDACAGVSQTVKRYWQIIEDQYLQLMAKYPNRIAHTFRSLQGCWDVTKPSFSRWAACLEQVRNAPPMETVESDYEKKAEHRYKDMEASEGKKFKLEPCWDLLKHYDKWKLIDRESPPKRGSLTNMDKYEDDDGPKNLSKPDGDKKTKEKIKKGTRNIKLVGQDRYHGAIK
ncbi:putative galacturonosyltransferase 14 [Hordeum vulgare]|nr:putative galacturonosyltransferase 14 [Hordeum vulgare]